MAAWRTIDDAAEAIGISRRTIERWIAQKLIKAYTVMGDRRTYVDLEEIERLREPRPKDETS